MTRINEKSDPVWIEFTKLVRYIYHSSGCKFDEFKTAHSSWDRAGRLLAVAGEPSDMAWQKNDVEVLFAAMGPRLTKGDRFTIECAHKAAHSIVEAKELPDGVSIDRYIDAFGRINWSKIEQHRRDFAHTFVLTEKLLAHSTKPTDSKRLRETMHEAKKRLSDFQAADRLYLALMSVSKGLLPLQARGSFEYMCWYYDMIDGWADHTNEVTPESVSQAVAGTPYEGWDIWNCGKELFLVDIQLCQKIAKAQSTTLDSPESKPEFFIEPTAENQLICGRSLTIAFRKEAARVFNAPKLRLCSDITAESIDEGTVTFQPTQYYSYLATNDATKFWLHSKVDNRAPRGNDFCLENGKMRTLRRSLCSNHVGGNTLAFTEDGHVGLHVQTTENHVRTGIAPTCAGSLDLADAVGVVSMEEFVIAGTVRELLEESLIRRDEQTTRMMGYAICPNRGYKPDFFLVTQLHMTLEDLKQRHDSSGSEGEEFVGPHYYMEIGKTLQEAIKSLRQRVADPRLEVPAVDDSTEDASSFVHFGSVLRLMLRLLLENLEDDESPITQFLFPKKIEGKDTR